MRVIAISPLPPYPSGLAYYSLNLYKELSKLCDVSILSNIDAEVSPSRNFKLIKCFTSSVKSAIRTLFTAFKMHGELIHIQVEYRFIGSLLNFLMLPLLLLFAKASHSNKKTVITLHGVLTKDAIKYWLDEISSLRLPKVIRHIIAVIAFSIWIFSIRFLALLSDVIIVHNTYMKERLESILSLQERKKLGVIPHGVYKPSAKNLTGLSSNDQYIILFLGFIRHSKGLTTLIKAMKLASREIPNLKLVIVGRMIKRSWEKPLKIRSHDSLTVISNELPDEQLDKLITQASIIVFPYDDKFIEASGSLCRVALFFKPVICTRIPRFYELTHMQDAIIIKPGDYQQLANFIVYLLKNRKLSLKLGKNLAEKFSSKTWNKVARMHHELFLKVLGER